MRAEMIGSFSFADIMKSKSNPDILKMAAATAKRSERTMRSKVSPLFSVKPGPHSTVVLIRSCHGAVCPSWPAATYWSPAELHAALHAHFLCPSSTFFPLGWCYCPSCDSIRSAVLWSKSNHSWLTHTYWCVFPFCPQSVTRVLPWDS